MSWPAQHPPSEAGPRFSFHFFEGTQAADLSDEEPAEPTESAAGEGKRGEVRGREGGEMQAASESGWSFVKVPPQCLSPVCGWGLRAETVPVSA